VPNLGRTMSVGPSLIRVSQPGWEVRLGTYCRPDAEGASVLLMALLATPRLPCEPVLPHPHLVALFVCKLT
jgi:hypothetical protein